MTERKFEFKTVREDHQYGGFDVHGFDRFPRGSALAGQSRKCWLANYSTREAAKAAHPDAKMGHDMLDPVNTFDHLPDGPDYG